MAKKKSDYVSVNLLPISILLAAIIISATILFSQGRDNDKTDNTDNDTTQTTDGDFADAETSIDDDPYIGDKDKATVAIVEFSEYQCSYCKRHTDETLPDLIENYVDTGKIIYVFRDFQMYGEVSETNAKYGECIAEEYNSEKFLDYHIGAFGLATVAEAESLITDLGLDLEKIKVCSTDETLTDEQNADMTDGQDAGISGTPGFVIGTLDENGNVTGKLVAGAYPYDSFVDLIEEYLD